MKEHPIFVDGQPKGEAFKRGGKWYWRRPGGSADPFSKTATLNDVAEWARKCCNGGIAEVR